MSREKRPDYLSPSPTWGAPRRPRDLSREPVQRQDARTHPAQQRGHSGMFISEPDRRARLRHPGAGRGGDRRGAHAAAPEALLVRAGDLPDQLARAVAERYGLATSTSASTRWTGSGEPALGQCARRYHAVPIGYIDEETLLLAMADPANVLALDDIQMMTGLSCRVAVAADEDVEALIERLNRLESAVSEAVDEEEDEEGEAEVTDLRESADDAP